MKIFFKELFDYNSHFNMQLVKVILNSEKLIPEKSFKLFCHILNAHEIWNTRIEDKPNVYEIWQIHKSQDLERILQLNQENTTAILEKFSLEEMITYSKGKGNKKVRDILFHIINHSTYHRAQIAMDFRNNGLEPIATEYIHWNKMNDA